MSSKVVLAYDLGTTGNKVTLYRPADRSLTASTLVSYPTNHPRPTWVEQDPNDWWEAVCKATAQVLNSAGIHPSNIACVTFSGQMMGCVAVDKNGQALRPALIWADQRGVSQAARICANIDPEMAYNITGHRVSPSYSAAKIMWIMDNEPEIFQRAHKFLHAKDYIVARLTGNFATDYSDASGMNLFDIHKLEWSPELLAATGIPREKLPDAHPSTAVIGGVTAEAARITGLLEGTPVVIGGGDGTCAAVGAGVVKPGVAYNYVGSSSWIGVATSKPINDPKMRTFNWAHVLPNLYSPTGTMQAAGASYQWLRDQLCAFEVEVAAKEGKSTYALMDKMAAAVVPGSDNLLYLPYLLGERSPRWNTKARGAFIGLTVKHTRGHIIRSVMEGVAFNLKVIIDAFVDQGAKVNEMRLIGGAANSPVWSQIMADIYGVPIYKSKFPAEATSLGAALVGAVGVGLAKDFSNADEIFQFEPAYIPNTENVNQYQALYKIFNNAYENLVPIYEALS